VTTVQIILPSTKAGSVGSVIRQIRVSLTPSVSQAGLCDAELFSYKSRPAAVAYDEIQPYGGRIYLQAIIIFHGRGIIKVAVACLANLSQWVFIV
jgi:hypothetical protein